MTVFAVPSSDGLPDDVKIVAVMAAPQRTTQHDNRLAFGMAFIFGETSAYLRLNSNQRKELWRHATHVNLRWFANPGEVESVVGPDPRYPLRGWRLLRQLP